MPAETPAVVLLSGGLDSTTALWIALDQGFRPYALSCWYGQRHAFELASAAEVAAAAGVEHRVVDIDLGAFGGSALVDDGEVPKDRSDDEIGTGIPPTYVPARNTVLLSLAVAWAETLAATDIFIGVNAVDSSGYPDCRRAFVEAFERTANLGTRAGVEGDGPYRIHAPLIELTKADIIRAGTALGVDYALTTTCYDPDPAGACGACDACRLRLRGFEEAGMVDPIAYRAAS